MEYYAMVLFPMTLCPGSRSRDCSTRNNLKVVQDRAISIRRVQSIKWCHFQWPWTRIISSAHHHSALNISETVQDTLLQRKT